MSRKIINTKAIAEFKQRTQTILGVIFLRLSETKPFVSNKKLIKYRDDHSAV